MTWNKNQPQNDELLINAPALIRANWTAIELCTDVNLQIDESKCASNMNLDDTKLATITTAGKVNGSALISLDNIEILAGDIPNANLDNAMKTSDAQSIDGIKTFTSFPITPSSAPTNDYDVANKKYVDDNAIVTGDETDTDIDQESGTGSALAMDTIYQCKKAGEISAYSVKQNGDNSASIYIYTGETSTVTTRIYQRITAENTNYRACASMIIKAGTYWKVRGITGGTYNSWKIYFRPLG